MIIIVGGGIAGLSLGWQLAKRDIPVTVLESEVAGSGASQAAGSYLEPRVGSGAMRRLEWAAIHRWRAFAGEIEQASGQSIDYRRDGMIRIAYTDNLEKIRADFEERQIEGWAAQWLERADLAALEPNLSARVVAGTFLPDIDSCDARLLCTALAEAIRNNGGTVHERAKVTALVQENGRVTGARLESGATVSGDKTVLCAGLDTNGIGGLPSDVPKSRPVKGVMLALRMDPDNPAVTRLIKRPDGILCPRSDGRLLIGVTYGDGEAGLTATRDEIEGLMTGAARALPLVRNLSLIDAIVGVRSLVGDGTLRLGRSNAAENLYYSLSHAGTGFMRAPAISEELADYLISPDAECPHIAPFLQR